MVVLLEKLDTTTTITVVSEFILLISGNESMKFTWYVCVHFHLNNLPIHIFKADNIVVFGRMDHVLVKPTVVGLQIMFSCCQH